MLDIDGILIEYPKVFLIWTKSTKDLDFMTLEEMKESMTVEQYEAIKKEYRYSGVKRELPIVDGAKEIMLMLKKLKWNIWVVTSRPNMHPVNTDTRYWLDNNVPYDKLTFQKDKKKLFNKSNGIKLVVDDNQEFLEWVKQNHTDIYVSNGNWNELEKWLSGDK